MVRTRGGAVAAPPPTTSKSLLDSFMSAASEAPRSAWECSACTFENRSPDRNCQVCGKRDRRRRQADGPAPVSASVSTSSSSSSSASFSSSQASFSKRKAGAENEKKVTARKRKKAKRKPRVPLLPSPSMSPSNSKASTSPDSVVIEDDTEQQLEREEITRKLLGVAPKLGVPASAFKVSVSTYDYNEEKDDCGAGVEVKSLHLKVGTHVMVQEKSGVWSCCQVTRKKSKNVYYVSWIDTDGHDGQATKKRRTLVTFFGPKARSWRLMQSSR